MVAASAVAASVIEVPVAATADDQQATGSIRNIAHQRFERTLETTGAEISGPAARGR